MPSPSSQTPPARPHGAPGSYWTFWPNPDPDIMGEQSYSPAFVFKVDLPILLGLLLVFSLPVVREWTGCNPWIIAAGFLLHFGYALILMAGGIKKFSPPAREFFSHASNLAATVAVPLASPKPLFALWGLYLLVVLIEAMGNPKSWVGLFLSAAAPWVDILWHADDPAIADRMVVAGIACGTGVTLYVVWSYFIDWTREGARTKALVSKQAALIEERARIGQGLHSSLGAALSEISLWHEVALAAGTPNGSADPLAKAQARARSALTDLRALVADMDGGQNAGQVSPDSLYAGIRNQISGLCEAGGISLQFRTPDPVHERTESENAEAGKLDIATEYHITKVVVESVTNAVRHARPHSIRVSLSLIPLVLEVDDDGIGFDPATATRGRGLRSLQEHAEALGATLYIRSTPGAGTRIQVTGENA